MKSILALSAAMMLGGIALPLSASAAGCASGAAVGGVAGHVAGHHALLGAAAGCAVGHHEKNKQNAAASTPAPAAKPQ